MGRCTPTTQPVLASIFNFFVQRGVAAFVGLEICRCTAPDRLSHHFIPGVDAQPCRGLAIGKNLGLPMMSGGSTTFPRLRQPLAPRWMKDWLHSKKQMD